MSAFDGPGRYGNVQFIRSDDAESRIAELPPELVADDCEKLANVIPLVYKPKPKSEIAAS